MSFRCCQPPPAAQMAMLPSSLPLNKCDGTALPASEQNKVRDDHVMHHVV